MTAQANRALESFENEIQLFEVERRRFLGSLTFLSRMTVGASLKEEEEEERWKGFAEFRGKDERDRECRRLKLQQRPLSLSRGRNEIL